MPKEQETLDTSGTLNIQSRSPRSLQGRNTKNLSLNIDDNSVRVSNPGNFTTVPNITTKPLVIGQNMLRSPSKTHQQPPLMTKSSEASIYSVPLAHKASSTSPIYANSGLRNAKQGGFQKIGRVHSLSLSVKTKELKPSSSMRERSQTLSSAFETSTPQLRDFGGAGDKKTWILPEDDINACESSSPPSLHEKLDINYSNVYKENAYPEGPLLVIPPNIFLYSEPTLQEVLKFDVVINVASEVMSLDSLLPNEKKIEYHHILWTHSSKISLDLDRVTELIQVATLQNKKILIHCQCGVSRSASLIVAYIMKFYKMGLNDAYNHLKSTAKEISPNMGLIFQLMEWSESWSKGNTKSTGAFNEHEKANRQLQYREEAERYGMLINSSSSPNDLSLVSPDMTPKTPGDYFKNSSSSSASTSSSTIVEHQTNLKSVALSPDLENFSPTISTDTVTTTSGDFWS